jgi:LEA14-like dessication related protein
MLRDIPLFGSHVKNEQPYYRDSRSPPLFGNPKSGVSRFLLAGMALFLMLPACGYLRLEQPKVQAGAVNVARLDFEKADLVVDLDVSNPNPSTLVIAGYTYDLQIESHPFLQGASDTEFELKPKAVTRLHVPVSVKFAELLDRLKALKGKADAAYALAVTLAVKTPVAEIPLSFTKEGRVPVLSVPQVRLRGVRLGATSAEGMSLEALVEVSDPGPSVTLAGFSYALSLNGVPLAAGSDDKPAPTPDGHGHLLRLPIPLDASKARVILGALLVGDAAPMFTIAGKVSFASPYGTITLPFTHTEKLKVGR